jgi:hypothetical protein
LIEGWVGLKDDLDTEARGKIEGLKLRIPVW